MALDSENSDSETDSPGPVTASSIPSVSGTTVAFVGRTQRGPVDRAVAINSYEEYRRVFGGAAAFSFMSHAVLHFFQNGGQRAVVVRLMNRGRRASLQLAAGDERLTLTARHPGSHELIRVSADHDGWDLHPSRFNLTVQRVARQGSQLVEDQEIYRGLSVDRADQQNFVDALSQSELVAVAGPLPSKRPARTVASYPGEPVAYVAMNADGSDGDELTDYDLIGSREEGTGFFALNQIEQFDLLCIPAAPGRDLGITTLVAADRYCRGRRAMLIVDPSWSWKSAESALLGLRKFGFSSECALSYFPRVRPREGGHRFPEGIPACGAVAGILARKDERYGLWEPLSADNGSLRGSLAPTCDISFHQDTLLRRHGVNCFVRRGAGSPALEGNVSFAGQGALRGADQKLSGQRLLLRLMHCIEAGTAFARDRTPNAELRQRMVRVTRFFLLALFEAGAFQGSSPEQAFFVHPAGEETNALVIGVALSRPRRFSVFEVSHSAAGSTSQLLATENVAGLAV